MTVLLFFFKQFIFIYNLEQRLNYRSPCFQSYQFLIPIQNVHTTQRTLHKIQNKRTSRKCTFPRWVVTLSDEIIDLIKTYLGSNTCIVMSLNELIFWSLKKAKDSELKFNGTMTLKWKLCFMAPEVHYRHEVNFGWQHSPRSWGMLLLINVSWGSSVHDIRKILNTYHWNTDYNSVLLGHLIG